MYILDYPCLSIICAPPPQHYPRIMASALCLYHDNTLCAVTHCSVPIAATSYHGLAAVRINVKTLRFTMCQLIMLTEHETSQIH